jgi:putative aldouronate transport system permease protein
MTEQLPVVPKSSSKVRLPKLPKLPSMKVIKDQKFLLLMSLPFVVWIFIFKYIPLWGWTIAFQNYRPGKNFFSQEWVGVKYFIAMFKDGQFYDVMRNTLGMSFLALLFGFTLPIILAILLNEIKTIWFKRTVQTISYLPHFVSWVIVASIFNKMLSIDGGFVNEVLKLMNLVKDPGIILWPNLSISGGLLHQQMCGKKLAGIPLYFLLQLQVFLLIYMKQQWLMVQADSKEYCMLRNPEFFRQ